MKHTRIAALVLTALLPGLLAAQSALPMGSILDALVSVLPLTVNEDRFHDRANAATIEKALRVLAYNAAAIDDHATGFEPSYDLVRRTFADDTTQALTDFEAGDLRMARFLLGNLTNDCFACHSRLPADDSPLTPRLPRPRRSRECARPGSPPPPGTLGFRESPSPQ